MHVHQVCIKHAVFITLLFDRTKKEFFWSLSVITAKNEKENRVHSTVRVRYINSYFEKGCQKKCTRQSRKIMWVVLSSMFFKEI